jgi:hypothetical protein
MLLTQLLEDSSHYKKHGVERTENQVAEHMAFTPEQSFKGKS